MTANCPYCGNTTFVGATTELRDGTPLIECEGGPGLAWNNRCALPYGCGLWSVHDDDTGVQLSLVDPDDKDSATL